MEVFTFESPSSTPYASAPSSPHHFYTAPNSPTRGPTNVSFAWELELGEGKTSTGDSFDSDDFEFNTSQQFEGGPLPHQQPQQKQQHGVDPPVMSFADELFCNGQVLPLKQTYRPSADELFCNGQVLPLKPPPRLQYVNTGKFGNQSSSVSSPKSLSSVLKGPFVCLSVGNEDFDPFMAAIENVRKERRGRDLGTPHRRARSLSPLRTSPQWSNDSTARLQCQNKEVGSPQTIPREPTRTKRLVSAMPVGCVRLSIKPIITKLSASIEKTNATLSKSATKSRWFYSRGSLKQRIKDFLSRSTASEGRTDNKDKLRDQTVAVRRSHYLRRYSFNFTRETQELKKSVILYKPSLSLCLSFGSKMRSMN